MPSNSDRTKDAVVVTGKYLRESEKAVCLALPDETGRLDSHWLPKSQFKHESIMAEVQEEGKETRYLTCFVPRWLAEKNELHHTEYDEAMDYTTGEASSGEPEEEPEEDEGWTPPF